MRHGGAEAIALLPQPGEGRGGSFHTQTAIHGKEAQCRVTQQATGQQPGFNHDLKTIADAKHMPARRGKIHHRTHDG